MNKKIISLVLAVLMIVMCFSLAACGNKGADNTSDSASSASTAESTDAAAKASDLAYIKEKGTLVVGITDYEPMNYKDDKGEWTGFDTEFAQAFAEKIGVKCEFIEINWDNKFIELDSKKIDCIWNGMTITNEVKLNSNVSKAYVKNAQVVVMKASALDSYKDVESLADLKFVAEAGSAGEAAVKETIKATNYLAVSAQSDALLEVESGTADACVIDITMANAMTGEGTSYADLAYSIELAAEEYGVAFRKDSDATDEFNKIMQELIDDGTLTALAEKYELTLVK